MVIQHAFAYPNLNVMLINVQCPKRSIVNLLQLALSHCSLNLVYFTAVILM